MSHVTLMEVEVLLSGESPVLFDCRFSLADPDQGRRQYSEGHIPGAYFLDLNNDLAGPVAAHGGRHPLPDARVFAALLARHGVGPETEVVAYDDSRFAGAARLWWLMRALGYRPPRLLNGGYQAYLAAGGQPQQEQPPMPEACEPVAATFSQYCDRDGLRDLQGQGAVLLDSREASRYQGLEEPIDPVAGHIPGALNRPWQAVTDKDGKLRETSALREHFGDTLEAEKLVVYCGSGVTACVNLFALAALGRDEATLYAGSWSDWCSYL